MPLKDDYIRDTIKHLEKAISLCGIVQDIITAKDTEKKIEDCLEEAMNSLTEYQSHGETPGSLFVVGDVIFKIDPSKKPRVFVKDQCNKCIDMIYHSLDELRPVKDPAQIEIFK